MDPRNDMFPSLMYEQEGSGLGMSRMFGLAEPEPEWHEAETAKIRATWARQRAEELAKAERRLALAKTSKPAMQNPGPAKPVSDDIAEMIAARLAKIEQDRAAPVDPRYTRVAYEPYTQEGAGLPFMQRNVRSGKDDELRLKHAISKAKRRGAAASERRQALRREQRGDWDRVLLADELMDRRDAGADIRPSILRHPRSGYGIRGRAAREHGDPPSRHQRAQLRLEERHRVAMKEARADDKRGWERYARLLYGRDYVDVSDSDSD